MLLREKDTRDSSDAIQPPYAAADSTRDQTLYYVQNWRADVVALLNENGRAVEHVRYTAYGSPRRLNMNPVDIAFDDGSALPPVGTATAGKVNNGVETGDYNLFLASFFDSLPAANVANDDGTPLPPFGPLGVNNGVTEGDYNLFFAKFYDGGVDEPGLSAPDVANTIGYAGYEHDPILLTPSALSADPNQSSAAYYHVRHRVYDAGMGRWTKRDPLGYVDGMGLYEYCKSTGALKRDPYGLCCACQGPRDNGPSFPRELPYDPLDGFPFPDGVQEVRDCLNCFELLAAFMRIGLTWIEAAFAMVRTIPGCAACLERTIFPEILMPTTLPAGRGPGLNQLSTLERCVQQCGHLPVPYQAQCLYGCNAGLNGTNVDCVAACGGPFNPFKDDLADWTGTLLCIQSCEMSKGGSTEPLWVNMAAKCRDGCFRNQAIALELVEMQDRVDVEACVGSEDFNDCFVRASLRSQERRGRIREQYEACVTNCWSKEL